MAERTEIDGVPVFWGETPGPLAALLVFRVGMADEPFVQRGVTHLVEHLALSGLGRPSYSYNGSVDLNVTSFMAQGNDADIVEFLNGVTRSLAALPFDRIDTELGVLRTEETRRGPSPTGRLLALRFGCRAYGLPDYPELALQGIAPDVVDQWRGYWFNASNAALVLSGPPPAGIDLSALPAGDRRPPDPPRPLDRPLPGWSLWRDNIVAVSMFAPRSRALDAGIEVLDRALRQRLREEDGISYQVGASTERVGVGHTHVLVVADAVDDRINEAREALASVVARYRIAGPTQDDLDEFRAEVLPRRAEDPNRDVGRAAARAYEWLFTRTQDEPWWEDEVAILTAYDLKVACAEALASAIWLLPPDAAGRDQRLVRLTTASSYGLPGAGHPPVPALREEWEGHRLVLDPSGVSRWVGDEAVTVRYADNEAVQVWQDGARTVWAADGSVVFVHPGAWIDGPDAVAAIDRAVAPGRVVVMRSSSAFDPPAPPPPPTAARPGRARFGRRA